MPERIDRVVHAPARPLAMVIITAMTLVLVTGACHRSRIQDGNTAQQAAAAASPWQLDAAQDLSWQADDDHYAQDHRIEASGLAASERFLYATVEKYGVVLRIDPAAGYSAQVMHLDVPSGTELEGVAFADGAIFLCDEHHAAVYTTTVEDGEQLAAGSREQPLPVTRLALELELTAGKVGLEGIAVTPDGSRVYLLNEREKGDDGGCFSTIFRLRREHDTLIPVAEPLRFPLPSCDWRMCSLELLDGRLLALKTRYPNKTYRIIEIDPERGQWRKLTRLDALAEQMKRAGYGDNIEGMAVSSNGDLYLVSDNAMTGGVDINESPPPADERTLLLYLPAAR